MNMSKRGTLASFSRLRPARFPYSCGALTVVFVLGVTTLLLFGFEDEHVKFTWRMSAGMESSSRTRHTVTYVPSLIQAIRDATARVSGDSEFSDLERATWREQNPCRSREELEPFYTRRKFVKHVKRNPKWDAVLREYEALHRACMRRVGGNATRYFLERNASSGCRFAVAGGPGWAGLGNKVLPTLAVLLYAVLTQRVLLVPAVSRLPDIMCEPFAGSSWRVDPDQKFTPSEKHEDVWRPFSEFTDVNRTQELYAVRPASWCQPVARFYCDSEQEMLTAVPWLYFTSCIVFMPKLFTIPAFRPVLEELFPDGMATTHLIRSVMHPADRVWTRVRNVEAKHPRHAGRRLGVQIRYRDLKPQFQALHTVINNRVLQCATQHNMILPDQNTTIFVTSLFPDLREFLSKLYPTSGIFQLSQGMVQKFGLEEDVQAFSEVMCLSFSDDLLVTPLSTFGSMAQAYGALRPYFLEFRNDSALLPPCERGASVDPCCQDAQMAYVCPLDRGVDGKVITELVDAIRACPVIDTPHGVQLVTNETASSS